MNATQTRPAARAPQMNAPAARRMTLSSIRKSLERGPEKLFLYGIEGVGKSSFAAAAPDAVFLTAEDGIRNLTPVPESSPIPETFQDVLDARQAVAGDRCDLPGGAARLCQAHHGGVAQMAELHPHQILGKPVVARLSRLRNGCLVA